MKTAIVMEINAGTALLMKTGGEFETVPAQSGWQKGDVVSIAEKRRSFKALYMAAACLVLVMLGSLGGHRLYFTETALISVDINPSIEMSINRFDRVIGTAFYNDDGEALLSAVDLGGMSSGDALEALLQSDSLRPYLEGNDYLDITVSGNGQLERQIQDQAQSFASSYKLQLSCHSANAELVTEAHANGMTPGRYLAFLELQELEPEVEIEDYSACGVGQIRREIEEHHRNRYGWSHSVEEQADDSGGAAADEETAPAGNGGHGQGQGHGQGAVNTADPESGTQSGENGQGGGYGHGGGEGQYQGGGQAQDAVSTDNPESGTQSGENGQSSGYGHGGGEGQYQGGGQAQDAVSTDNPESDTQSGENWQGGGYGHGGGEGQYQGSGQAQDAVSTDNPESNTQSGENGQGGGYGHGSGQGQEQGSGQGQGGAHGRGHD